MNIPHGMTEVSRKVFWDRVMSETRDIRPRSERDHTEWEVASTRERWGWTSEGYATPHFPDEPERFAIAEVAS